MCFLHTTQKQCSSQCPKRRRNFLFNIRGHFNQHQRKKAFDEVNNTFAAIEYRRNTLMFYWNTDTRIQNHIDLSFFVASDYYLDNLYKTTDLLIKKFNLTEYKIKQTH